MPTKIVIHFKIYWAISVNYGFERSNNPNLSPRVFLFYYFVMYFALHIYWNVSYCFSMVYIIFMSLLPLFYVQSPVLLGSFYFFRSKFGLI